MTLNTRTFLEKNLIMKMFLLIGFFITWGSLSSSIEDIEDILTIARLSEFSLHQQLDVTRKNIFFQFIHFARSTAVLIYFPLSIYCFITFHKKINFKLHNEWYFVLVITYLFLQTPGLFISENSLYHIYYTISAFNVVIIMHLASKIFTNDEIKLFYYISLLFLVTIFCYYFVADLWSFLNKSNSFYSNFNPITNEMDLISPRSSGMSRTAIFILIMILPFTFNSKKEIVKNIVITILCTLIILYQSRTSIGMLVIFLILEIIFQKKYNFFSTVKKISIIIIIPTILFFSITHLKMQMILSKKISNAIEVIKNSKKDALTPINIKSFGSITQSDLKLIISECMGINKISIGNLRCEKIYAGNLIRNTPPSFSSNRFEDWKSLVNLFIGNKRLDEQLLGFGAQGDRFILKQTISNGILYSLASSGVLGLLAFIIFSIILLYYSFFYLINKKQIKNPYIYVYVFLIVIILARSVLETSYAVFGIDLIMLNMAFFSIRQDLKKNLPLKKIN